MKVKSEGKTYRLNIDRSRKVMMWRWSRATVVWTRVVIAYATLGILLAIFVSPNFLIPTIGVLFIVFMTVALGAAMDDDLGSFQVRYSMKGSMADAVRNFSSITEGPFLTLAQECLRSVCEEYVEDISENTQKWLDVSRRLVDRSTVEKQSKPSRVHSVSDFLDGLDDLDNDSTWDKELLALGDQR